MRHHHCSLTTIALLLLTVGGAGSRAQQAAPTPPAPDAGEAASLAYTISPSDPRLRYEGRFDLFQVARGGRLLPPPPRPARRLEVIGDSISCGYGNEAKDQHERFTSATENASLSYGAVAARAVGAEYTCLAWSGRTMWPKNTMGEIYDLALPLDPGSRWDFARWTPDAVVIALSTNDFAGGTPGRAGWMAGYEAFLARVRRSYPRAAIYCATSPMMAGSPAAVAKSYLTQIVADENAVGDRNIKLLVFETQDGGKNGFGADWHPSVKTDALMADKLAETLAADLGWTPATAKKSGRNHVAF